MSFLTETSLIAFIAPSLALFLSIVVILIMVFLLVYVKNSQLGIEKKKIELEVFRKSLENDIYKTTEKLGADKSRWEDVNHMIYEASRRSVNLDSNNQFLNSLSIDRSKIKLEKQKVFLLAPINSYFSEHRNIIKKACEEVGLSCETADDEFISGPILSVIVKKILSSELIVAVIDGRNPNVFYEIGLAHAFGKKVVMISNGDEDIPFDIQSQRMVMVDWSNGNSSKEKIRKSIAKSMYTEKSI